MLAKMLGGMLEEMLGAEWEFVWVVSGVEWVKKSEV
jgi:hypothetical protein